MLRRRRTLLWQAERWKPAHLGDLAWNIYAPVDPAVRGYMLYKHIVADFKGKLRWIRGVVLPDNSVRASNANAQ